MKKQMKRLLAVFFGLLFVLQLNAWAASGWYDGYKLTANISNNHQSSSHSISGNNPSGTGFVFFTENGKDSNILLYGSATTSTWTAYSYKKYRYIYKAGTSLKRGDATLYTIVEAE